MKRTARERIEQAGLGYRCETPGNVFGPVHCAGDFQYPVMARAYTENGYEFFVGYYSDFDQAMEVAQRVKRVREVDTVIIPKLVITV